MTKAEAIESALVWAISAAHCIIVRQATLCAGGIALAKALFFAQLLANAPYRYLSAWSGSGGLIVARHPVMEHLAALNV